MKNSIDAKVNNSLDKDLVSFKSFFYLSLKTKWDIIYFIIGVFISLFYFLGYYFYETFYELSHYCILFSYLLVSIFVIRHYSSSLLLVLLFGYIFRIISIDFTLTNSFFVDFDVFSKVSDFFGYYALESFSYIPSDLWYLLPFLSFFLDTLIFIFVYYILRYNSKNVYFLILLWWNPFWIASIYTHWNPFLIYVFFLLLSFFFLLYRQRFVAAISLVFVFGFYDFFYIFLFLSLYELKGAFLILVLSGFGFLNIYLEFMVRRFIYSDFVQDVISYLGSDNLLSFDNMLFLFLGSFLVVSWFWSIFFKRSFIYKVYIGVFVLLLIYPPFFDRGLSLLVVIFGIVFSNWGFLILSLYFFVLPFFDLGSGFYIEYVIIWLSFLWFIFVYIRSGGFRNRIRLAKSS